MKMLQHKVILGLAAFALLAASLGLGAGVGTLARKVNEYEGQHLTRKVNEYEGQHLAKVNEYEGQHRNVHGDPSQWG